MKTSSSCSTALARTGRFSSVAVALGALLACGSPSNNGALFAVGGARAGASAGSMNDSSGGAGNSAGSGGTGISTAGGTSTAGDGSGASAGAHAGENSGAGGGAVDPPQAGSDGTAGSMASLVDCSARDANATYYSGTEHCYLVVHALSTYADAQNHCASLGSHLVTIASEDENGFVWDLDTNEHWIGTSDHKGPKETEPGTYTWVTGEPFLYTAWSAGQPNASKTSCGDANGGGDCYEHCGFQWTGGEHDGQWNDRYCLHTIESVCEWDK